MTFEEFLTAELDGLRKYAMALAGERQQAHDVLADALVIAQAKWSRIGSLEQPLAYVRRMVTNGFVSEKRRWASRAIRPTRSGELPERLAPDPTAAVDDREQLQQLLAALQPRQRAMLVLRFYLDFDNAAIGRELGMSVGAVRTAVSRALVTLRLADADDDADVDASPHHPADRAVGTDDDVRAGRSADTDDQARADRAADTEHRTGFAATAFYPHVEEDR